MIVEVIMPKLGMYEDDVTLIEWLAADGAEVAIGDPLFVMETEKTQTEIEAEDEGILVREAQAGYQAPIGSRIGYLASTDAEAAQLRADLGGA
jgi:pyruvate/2-oxoglutarate dehydrogenase complex dihydrolipoamide acyltransferase (E2) component